MNCTGLEEGKYTKWMRNLILQEMWAVNNGYLFSMLSTIIDRHKTPLNIDFRQIQEAAAQLTPTLFNIDSRLQI